MRIRLRTPRADELEQVIASLGEWHAEAAPFQLHPGDIGWFGWHGTAATAAALRTWSRGGDLLAVGLLDGPGLLRLAMAPNALADKDLAAVMADDIATPDAGVLPHGEVDAEIPAGASLRQALTDRGWATGEPWTHLALDLTRPGEQPAGLDVVTVDARTRWARTAVHRAAFGSDRFTDERWQEVASGPAYRRARCLLGSEGGVPAAAITIWSAGEGRPGIIEPMGVDPRFRGRGLGAQISRAGAAALRDLGASSARVGTRSANAAAVATYVAAGFTPFAEVTDLRRADDQGDTTPRTG